MLRFFSAKWWFTEVTEKLTGLDATIKSKFEDANGFGNAIDAIVSKSHEGLTLRLLKLDRDEMIVFFSNSRVTLFSSEKDVDQLVIDKERGVMHEAECQQPGSSDPVQPRQRWKTVGGHQRSNTVTEDEASGLQLQVRRSPSVLNFLALFSCRSAVLL